MKLAEALHQRADLQKRLAQLKARLLANAKVQEGEAPAEDPRELLAELERGTGELETLIRQINHTNCAVRSEGESITALLAKKDALALRVSILREFLSAASQKVERYARTEIRIQSSVPVKELQKQADDLSKELRELDVRIQALNWTVDLLEE